MQLPASSCTLLTRMTSAERTEFIERISLETALSVWKRLRREKTIRHRVLQPAWVIAKMELARTPGPPRRVGYNVLERFFDRIKRRQGLPVAPADSQRGRMNIDDGPSAEYGGDPAIPDLEIPGNNQLDISIGLQAVLREQAAIFCYQLEGVATLTKYVPSYHYPVYIQLIYLQYY